jgi:hypothetical protein
MKMVTPQHTALNPVRFPYHASHLANFIRRRLIEYKIEHRDYNPEELSSLCHDYQEAGGDRGAFAKMTGWPDE